MKSILQCALIGLLAISTTAYASNKKKKNVKKAHTTVTCPSNCPRTGNCHQ